MTKDETPPEPSSVESQLDMETADALYYFGVMAYRRGDYDSAVDLLDKAVRLNHDLTEALDTLNRILNVCT